MSRALRIVAADDDLFYHDLYQKMLAKLGHQVLHVAQLGTRTGRTVQYLPT